MIKMFNIRQVYIMGVINMTPDSYFKDSRVEGSIAFYEKVEKLLKEGVDIIDIGAISTRPGAKIITQEAEMERLKEVIPALKTKYPEILFSIDTVYGKTAKYCLEEGFDIVNDVSAWSIDSSLVDVVASWNCSYVLMHAQGRPESMQNNPSYDQVALEVLQFFKTKIKLLEDKGINQVIIDPGFGFGKTIDHNYELLNKLSVLKILNCPIMIGLSRKSMITRYLDIDSEEALAATSALHMVSLQNGANILRVHDVKEAVQIRSLREKLTAIGQM